MANNIAVNRMQIRVTKSRMNLNPILGEGDAGVALRINTSYENKINEYFDDLLIVYRLIAK